MRSLFCILIALELISHRRRAFDHLSATKPEVADKVHMFNSFFYKKLSARKTQKEDS